MLLRGTELLSARGTSPPENVDSRTGFLALHPKFDWGTTHPRVSLVRLTILARARRKGFLVTLLDPVLTSRAFGTGLSLLPETAHQ